MSADDVANASVVNILNQEVKFPWKTQTSSMMSDTHSGVIGISIGTFNTPLNQLN